MVNSFPLWVMLISCLLVCVVASVNAELRSFNRKRLSELFDARDQSNQFDQFIERLAKYSLVAAMVRTALSLSVMLAALEFFRAYDWQTWQHYLAAFLVAGSLLSVFAVSIPVSWANYSQERLLVRSKPLLDIALFILWPFVIALGIFDPIVRRISGVDLKPTDNDEKLTEELISVVEEHQDEDDVGRQQKEMLEAIVEFPNTTVGEIMTPRTEVAGIESGATLPQIKAFIQEEGHSRYPVYHESLDNIEGILYAKDLLRYVASDEPFAINKTLRPPMLVPESKSVRELLAEFNQNKVHIAIALDEYGGTAGLITIEDILEEIVGEIHDEYEPADEEDPRIDMIDERRAQVDGRVYIDDLNDAMGIDLPEDEDYDTVGGFVFSRLGHIPTAGEHFQVDNLSFTVTDIDRTRVKRVLVEQIEISTNGNGNGRK